MKLVISQLVSNNKSIKYALSVNNVQSVYDFSRGDAKCGSFITIIASGDITLIDGETKQEIAVLSNGVCEYDHMLNESYPFHVCTWEENDYTIDIYADRFVTYVTNE